MITPMGRAACAILLSLSSVACAQNTDGAVRELNDLPLVEVAPKGRDAATLAIFLTGDGGWAEIDKQVSGVLTEHGIGVVGVNSRSYLSKKKTPEQTASDVERIARAYMARWNARRLVLVGYSRGADMIPFIANRVPADIRERIVLLAMLGLAQSANFQFHLIDLVRDVHRSDDVPIAPELARLRGQRMLCVYGTQEKDSGCRDADSTLITRFARVGDHHFDENYRGLGELIVSRLPVAQ